MVEEDLAKCIDHTLLGGDVTEEGVRNLCDEATEYGFRAVCVNPGDITVAREYLIEKGCLDDVKITSVVDFPSGDKAIAEKVEEASFCVESGADELDVVVNIEAEKEGNLDYLKREISAINELEVPIKCIMETAALSPPQIRSAGKALTDAGADFLKTSTGRHEKGGATVEAVKLLSEVGKKVKASGGIRTPEEARRMIEAGADVIGTSSGVQIIEG